MRKIMILVFAIIMTFSTAAIPAEAKTRNDYENIAGTNIYVATDVSEDNIDKELEIYNKIDGGVRTALIKNDIRYYIIDEKNDNTTTGHTGDTLWPWAEDLSQIYGEGRMSKDIKYNGTVMYHEIGHIVDSLYGGEKLNPRWDTLGNPFGASNLPKWDELYKKYKDTIAAFGGLSKHEVYNQHEAFAESYAHYTVNPEMVTSKAPEIAEFMKMVNRNITEIYAPETINHIN